VTSQLSLSLGVAEAATERHTTSRRSREIPAISAEVSGPVSVAASTAPLCPYCAHRVGQHAGIGKAPGRPWDLGGCRADCPCPRTAGGLREELQAAEQLGAALAGLAS